MQERWLKSDEVRVLTQWSQRSIGRRAELGELKFREVKGKNSNGRPSREYLLNSLPAEFQLKFFSSASSTTNPKRETNSQIVPFRSAAIPAERPRIVLPNSMHQAQAEQRLSMIRRLVDYENLSAEQKRTLRQLPNDQRINSRNDLTRRISIETNTPPQTIARWLANYREGGFAALADRVRADKGQSRWFNQHHQAAILAAYLFLNERQSVSFAYEAIVRNAAQLEIADDDLPSRETVRIFLSRQISPAMTALAREGQREYRERMSPYLRRMYTDIFSNQIWVGDTAILDIEAANDLFPELPDHAPLRIRLCAMEDYRSRKIVGANFAVEGSSIAITATMLRGILQFGMPEMVYVDNGRDYRKVAKGTHRGFEIDPLRDEDFAPLVEKGLLARLGIGVTHCIPRHPQSKHIERFFRTLHMRFDSVHSTYTGGSPATRPESTEIAMMQHRRLVKKGRGAESRHPYASNIVARCLSWIEDYNDTPHHGEGMAGRSPNEVFETEKNPNQRPTPDLHTLAFLMAERQRRKVHECAIMLNRKRYVPRNEDRPAWAIMHENNEREVFVAFNPTDAQFAVALDLDGRFLAWLEAEQLARFAPDDAGVQKQIGESMEIRRALEKNTKATLAAIAAAARGNGALSAQDSLYSRLQLPSAAGDAVTHRKAKFAPPTQKIERPKTPDEVTRIISKLA